MRSALSLALLLAVPATAQAPAEPTPYQRAIAAGYKAAMLCSGIFNARESGVRRTRESIEANELKGVYPEYDGLIGGLVSTIDERRDAVLVEYAHEMPPRIAQARMGGGCTILPIGTKPETIERRLRIGRNPFAQAAWRPRNEPRDALPVALREPFEQAFQGDRYGGGVKTTAAIVSRDGKIVAERYAPGFTTRTPQRTWSVAKSMAGMLAGIAVDLKLADPRKAAPIPEWQTPGDPRRSITLDNLLRMSSGLHSPTAGNRTDAVYFGGTAVTEETIAWPMRDSNGSRFRYANNDILLATHAVASRFPKGRFSPDLLLFARLGMADTYAETDWRGNYILSSQVWSTARDLARFGQFMLQDGIWKGERLLPAGWMADSVKPLGPQPATGPGYGRTLWLFGPAQGLPAGSYAAQGNRGQYVLVIPSERLVIVRRGEDPGSARFDIARFAADVIRAR